MVILNPESSVLDNATESPVRLTVPLLATVNVEENPLVGLSDMARVAWLKPISAAPNATAEPAINKSRNARLLTRAKDTFCFMVATPIVHGNLSDCYSRVVAVYI